MDTSETDNTFSRRGFMRAGAGAAAAGVAATATAGVASADMDAYEGYLSEEDTWGGVTTDVTGRSGHTVRVQVGAEGNGDFHAFAPAAIAIDPGTTVQWVWTGDGGTHDVYHDVDDPVFESDRVNEEGHVYEHTFEEGDEGVYPYVCRPHVNSPMKGVVVVGEDNIETDTEPFLASPRPSLGGFLDDVANFRGVENWRGNDEVRVQVGYGDNGLLFEPAAINIDDGTTVIWEWTGEGGTHNVEHEGGEFESEFYDDEGETFEYTFEEDPDDESANVYNYVCDPHVGQGMLGSVVVGDNYPEADGPFNLSAVWGGVATFGVVSVLGVAVYRELVGDDVNE